MQLHGRTSDGARNEAPANEPSRERLVAMIVGSYREMPGLCLHVHQAARLFGIGVATCQDVLEQLVESGELGRMADGQYKIR